MKSCLKKFYNIHKKTPVLESLQACKFNFNLGIFAVNIAKFLRTIILKNIFQRLVLSFLAWLYSLFKTFNSDRLHLVYHLDKENQGYLKWVLLF